MIEMNTTRALAIGGVELAAYSATENDSCWVVLTMTRELAQRLLVLRGAFLAARQVAESVRQVEVEEWPGRAFMDVDVDVDVSCVDPERWLLYESIEFDPSDEIVETDLERTVLSENGVAWSLYVGEMFVKTEDLPWEVIEAAGRGRDAFQRANEHVPA